MRVHCGKKCFECKYDDCINDSPPSREELRMIRGIVIPKETEQERWRRYYWEKRSKK